MTETKKTTTSNTAAKKTVQDPAEAKKVENAVEVNEGPTDQTVTQTETVVENTAPQVAPADGSTKGDRRHEDRRTTVVEESSTES